MDREKNQAESSKKKAAGSYPKANASSHLHHFTHAGFQLRTFSTDKTDRRLLLRVEAAIERVGKVARHVRVSVRDRVVTISGAIPDGESLVHVMRAARAVVGVKGVNWLPSRAYAGATVHHELTSHRLRLLALLRFIVTQREEMQQEMRRLIESMTPVASVPLPPQVLQAQRNAAARHALLREFGAMTSADIGEVAGSKASNRAALAHRWKSDGRIFAVSHQGTASFPGFQFSPDGQPLPVIADIIRILGSALEGWELPLWFTASNGWLGGRRPVDLLQTEPEKVLAAAQQEAEALVF